MWILPCENASDLNVIDMHIYQDNTEFLKTGQLFRKPANLLIMEKKCLHLNNKQTWGFKLVHLETKSKQSHHNGHQTMHTFVYV